MHQGELWQEFDASGERINGAGYKASSDNPVLGSGEAFVGTASVWLYRHTDNGLEVLFQQRSMKISNPGKWDLSAGGHINKDEATIDAAIRELYEEIGVKANPSELEFIFCTRTIHTTQMFNSCFICNWTNRGDNFHFDDGEVTQIKWVPLADFDTFIDENVKDSIKKNRFTRELTKFWLSRKDGNTEK